MSKHWTDRLPELLESYTEAEPEGLWDAVQSGLTPPRRRIPAFWWYAAGGLLAAASIAAAWLLRPSSVSPAINSTPVSVTEVPAPSAPPASPVVPGDTTRLAQILPSNVSRPSQQVSPVQSEDIIPEGPDPETTPEAPSETTPEAVPEGPQAPIGIPQTPVASAEPRQRKKLSVQITVSGGGSPGQMASHVTQGYGFPASPGYNVSATKGADDAYYAGMLSRNRTSSTTSTHSQTASLQLGLSLGLSPHWRIESGLVYTQLRSSFQSLAGNSRSVTSRRMDYLGIPLHLQWFPYQWKRLSIYAYGGPMYEWAVGTQTRTDTYIGESLSQTETSHSRIPDHSWSLNAGAGLQLRLFRSGSLFFQPGVSWHIPNGTPLETFYSEHPFAFDFCFGFRFNL